uniref:Glycoside hydrolase family 13 N-terminal domain-containing protein n=1 Tax=Auxenochlorella protothecoides TaxID=3075 RepID=A0A1D2ADC3_AUXPR
MMLRGVRIPGQSRTSQSWVVTSSDGHRVARRQRPAQGPRCEAVKRSRKRPTASPAPASDEIAKPIRSPETATENPKKTTLEPIRQHRSVLPCRSGGQATVSVTEDEETIAVTIQLSGGPLSGLARPPTLLWGVYRGSSRRWQHPAGCSPPRSTLDERSGAMRSPFDMHGSITLRFPARLAPLTLAWVGAAAGRPVLPLVARHFAVPLGTLPGTPVPLGPSLAGRPGAERGANFALASRSAHGACLLLFRRGGDGAWAKALELELDPAVNRTGDVWHVTLPTLSRREGLAYAWRIDGEVAWDGGNRTQPDRLLLDPMASSLVLTREAVRGLGPLKAPSISLQEGEVPAFLLSGLDVLGADVAAGRPAGRSQAVPPTHQRCMVAVDVRGAGDGTLLGTLDLIPEIQALGFNTVVLSPCYATAWAGTPLDRGRAAVSYWAPDPTLASSPEAASREVQRLVAGLHAAGLAVLMQVDFTFTAEGGDDSPCPLSFRGLDHAVYYRRAGVLNAGHAVVRQYMIDVLRHWALDYGMDGFNFMGAENLVQDRNGVILDSPPLAAAIAYDPVLAGLQMIASTADKTLLPREGVRGFPHWGEWQESDGSLAAATLGPLCGSALAHPPSLKEALEACPAVFAAEGEGLTPGNLAVARPPSACVHTLALPPGGQDVALKTALLVALCAAGTPLLSLDDAARFARFVGGVTRLRRRWADLLLPAAFGQGARSVRWHGAAPGSEPDWDGSAALAGLPEAGFLAMAVVGPGGAPALYLAVNASDVEVTATPPAPPARHPWRRAVDTGLGPPEDAMASAPPRHPFPTYTLQPKAGLLLVADFDASSAW